MIGTKIYADSWCDRENVVVCALPENCATLWVKGPAQMLVSSEPDRSHGLLADLA